MLLTLLIRQLERAEVFSSPALYGRNLPSIFWTKLISRKLYSKNKSAVPRLINLIFFAVSVLLLLATTVNRAKVTC